MARLKEIVVYHGTTDSSAESIQRSKEFFVSTKNREWLGNGIYFWDLESDAEWWAGIECSKDKNKGTKPTILCTTLAVADDKYLDLDCVEHQVKFKNGVNPYLEQLKKASNGAPKNSITQHQLRCALCNIYKRQNGIALMAATFPVYNERRNMASVAYDVYGFPFVPERRQYCATDNTIIKNIEIKEVEDYAV